MVEVDPPRDPFDTWEPTKAVAPPAATEVLPSASFVAPAPVGAPVTIAPKSNKGIWIAAFAAVLLALAGGGWFLMNRSSTPPSDAPALIANNSVAETNTAATPLPSLAADAPAAAVTAGSPAPNAAVVNVKPAASVKAESKTDANAMPSPNPYAATKATAPEPVKPEPEKVAPVESNASWVEQGNRLASAGQFQEAIQLYEKAHRAKPGDLDVYYLIGSAYHRSGELANALEAYRKCMSGNYASVAANHVKTLEKKLGKTK